MDRFRYGLVASVANIDEVFQRGKSHELHTLTGAQTRRAPDLMEWATTCGAYKVEIHLGSTPAAAGWKTVTMFSLGEALSSFYKTSRRNETRNFDFTQPARDSSHPVAMACRSRPLFSPHASESVRVAGALTAEHMLLSCRKKSCQTRLRQSRAGLTLMEAFTECSSLSSCHPHCAD